MFPIFFSFFTDFIYVHWIIFNPAIEMKSRVEILTDAFFVTINSTKPEVGFGERSVRRKLKTANIFLCECVADARAALKASS